MFNQFFGGNPQNNNEEYAEAWGTAAHLGDAEPDQQQDNEEFSYADQRKILGASILKMQLELCVSLMVIAGTAWLIALNPVFCVLNVVLCAIGLRELYIFATSGAGMRPLFWNHASRFWQVRKIWRKEEKEKAQMQKVFLAQQQKTKNYWIQQTIDTLNAKKEKFEKIGAQDKENDSHAEYIYISEHIKNLEKELKNKNTDIKKLQREMLIASYRMGDHSVVPSWRNRCGDEEIYGDDIGENGKNDDTGENEITDDDKA